MEPEPLSRSFVARVGRGPSVGVGRRINGRLTRRWASLVDLRGRAAGSPLLARLPHLLLVALYMYM